MCVCIYMRIADCHVYAQLCVYDMCLYTYKGKYVLRGKLCFYCAYICVSTVKLCPAGYAVQKSEKLCLTTGDRHEAESVDISSWKGDGYHQTFI